MSLNPSSRSLPSRETMTESAKWMYATDNMLKLMSFGFLCSGSVAMIVFRSVAARASFAAFGTGCGIGKAYVDTKFVLGHDVPAEAVWKAEVTPTPSAEATN